MEDAFKIYVEQLREGHLEKIEETFPPTFIEVNEEDLSFVDPVTVTGEAYLAENELVLHFDISTMATIPCLICSSPVKEPIEIEGFYHSIPLGEIKGAVYNFKELLRESILLETPARAECNKGKCPQRQTLKKYLKEESPKKADNDIQDGYKPFADLDL